MPLTPSLKVTVPVGTPAGLCTEAVNVTGAQSIDCGALVVKVVELGLTTLIATVLLIDATKEGLLGTNLAWMVCVPRARLTVAILADPELFSSPVPNEFAPSRKSTDPLGVPSGLLTNVVKVTWLCRVMELALAVSIDVVCPVTR